MGGNHIFEKWILLLLQLLVVVIATVALIHQLGTGTGTGTDTDTDKDKVKDTIATVALIHHLGSDKDINTDKAKEQAVETVGEKQTEEVINNTTENITEFLHSSMLKLLKVFFGLVVLFLPLYLIHGAYASGMQRHDVDRKSKSFKISKKKTGGVSARHLYNSYKEVNKSLTEDRFISEKKSKSMVKVTDKMEKILITYVADEDEFGIVMYKYENTFKEIHATLLKAKKLQKQFDVNLYQEIEESLEYPFEEIVENASVKWAFKNLRKENEVLEDLKKQKE